MTPNERLATLTSLSKRGHQSFSLLLLLSVFFLVSSQLLTSAAEGEASSKNSGAEVIGFRSKVRPFFERNCINCHGPKKEKGDMRLDQLPELLNDNHAAESWQDVLDVLNAGEMPPEDEPQPRQEELIEVIGLLTDSLFNARKRLADKSYTTIRQLNRREYQNTIRDLLGVHIETDTLPEDGTLDGFDTVGDAQYMSAVQFEQYLELGRKALDRALLSGPRPETTLYHLEPEQARNKETKRAVDRNSANQKKAEAGLQKAKDANERKRQNQQIIRSQKSIEGANAYLGEPAAQTGFILNYSGANFNRLYNDRMAFSVPGVGKQGLEEVEGFRGEGPIKCFTRPGKYIVRIRAGLTKPTDPAHPLLVKVEKKNRGETYSIPLGSFNVSQPTSEPQIIELPFELLGVEQESIQIRADTVNLERKPENKKKKNKLEELAQGRDEPRIWIDWVEFEGPLIDDWPPAASTETLFKGVPDGQINETTYAREIIRRFAFKAFRHREPDSEYLEKVVGLFDNYRDDGLTFMDAIKESLALVLSSPSFTYLIEGPVQDGEVHRRLTDLELASRLSYFLWSAPPDEALYGLAEKGALSEPKALSQQVERMLNDPKSHQFVDAFMTQWLELGWLDMIVVNTARSKFPDFSEHLRQSFRSETIEFFHELLRENLSATNLIDSDFVVIDDLLARFYQIDTALAPGFHRVSLPVDSPRGGLLGQGAILTMTGTGERTSPVERGVFVYSKLLGRDVPPPPPNVPQLEISEKSMTVRESLEQHVAKTQCASCHKRMDPLGFGLENFDAIGKWRDSVGKRSRTIDATGVMPDGKSKFDGAREMKSYLVAEQDRMAEGLMKAMFTYALGRRVGFSDGEYIELMMESWKRHDYKMRTLIHRIVSSDQFRLR